MNRVYYLKLEIKELEKEIELVSDVSAMNYSGMPHSTGVNDITYNIIVRKAELIEKLGIKMDKLLKEIERIENIIEKIDDDEIRTMARMRFIKNMKWEDIGEQVHLDRTVCSKKVRKYLKEMEL